jgi:hypothetical protein
MFVSIRSPLEEEHASMYRTMMDVGVVLEHKDLVKRCGNIRTIRFTVIPLSAGSLSFSLVLSIDVCSFPCLVAIFSWTLSMKMRRIALSVSALSRGLQRASRRCYYIGRVLLRSGSSSPFVVLRLTK